MKMGMHGAAASLLILAMMAPGMVMAQQPATAAATGAKTTLTTDREKVSYAIGMDISRSFEPVAGNIDLDAMQRAVVNAFKGGKPLQSEEDAKQTGKALQMLVAAQHGQQVPGVAPGTLPPAPSKEQVGLMIGDRMLGPSLAPIKDEIELPIVMQAIRTSFAKGTPLLTDQQAQATLQAFGNEQAEKVARKNREEGAAFLAKNKTRKGVITTASGLQYMVLRQGSGQRPMPGSKVKVNYEGKLLNGTVFDSSYGRGEPAQFGLDQVIKGWSEGLQLMPVGSKYRFWIPADLAYGQKGTPGGPIGPDATLTFDVELMGILP